MTLKSKPLRGSGWQYSDKDAGEGTRLCALPTSDHENIGFRLVHDNADRVNRGGSWFYPAVYARAAHRSRLSPGGRGDFLGLRLVKDTA